MECCCFSFFFHLLELELPINRLDCIGEKILCLTIFHLDNFLSSNLITFFKIFFIYYVQIPGIIISVFLYIAVPSLYPAYIHTNTINSRKLMLHDATLNFLLFYVFTFIFGIKLDDFHLQFPLKVFFS